MRLGIPNKIAADQKLYNGLPGKHLAHFAAPANPEQKPSG
jgi:hypothetical protein